MGCLFSRGKPDDREPTAANYGTTAPRGRNDNRSAKYRGRADRHSDWAASIGPPCDTAHDAEARLAFAALLALGGSMHGVVEVPANTLHRASWLLRSPAPWWWKCGHADDDGDDRVAGAGDVFFLHRTRSIGVRFINGSNGWFSVTGADGMEHTWYTSDAAPTKVSYDVRGHRCVPGHTGVPYLADREEPGEGADASDAATGGLPESVTAHLGARLAATMPRDYAPFNADAARVWATIGDRADSHDDGLGEVDSTLRSSKSPVAQFAFAHSGDFSIWLCDTRDHNCVSFSADGVGRNGGELRVGRTKVVAGKDTRFANAERIKLAKKD